MRFTGIRNAKIQGLLLHLTGEAAVGTFPVTTGLDLEISQIATACRGHFGIAWTTQASAPVIAKRIKSQYL